MTTTIKSKLPGPIHRLQCLFATILIGIVIYSVSLFPAYKFYLAVSLCVYALLLWRVPSIWIIVIPALIPILDLTPISGRVFYGEFDFFILTTIAICLTRKEPWVKSVGFNRSTWVVVTLLTSWQLITTLNGLLPLDAINANSFSSYYSQFNALRIAKGFFAALFLLPAFGQTIYRGENVAKILSFGMLASLISGLLVIFWERSLFTGILNFNTPYRITGFFSIMATGGAPIDAHLIMTIPFIFVLFFRSNIYFKCFGCLLLLAALYGIAVTYSRANYPALCLSALVALLIWLTMNRSSAKAKPFFQRSTTLATLASLATMAALLIILVIPVFSGQYIQNRFKTTVEDFHVRIDHWLWSADMMKPSIATTVFGMGKGAFPRTYLWQRPDGEIPSIATHVSENDSHEKSNSFIKLGKSHPSGDLYLRQRFNVEEPGPYRLSIALKPQTEKPARLLIEICERIIFQAYSECNWVGIDSHNDITRWETYNRSLSVSNVGIRQVTGTRPVEIAILNRGMSNGLDIDNVQITTPSGKKLLKNSGFEQGMDHWFLYSGDHLSWHIKNIWFDSFFEGGILGLGIFIILFATLLFRVFVRVGKQDHLVIPLSSAFAGLLIVGMFDSLFDDPRIGLMFFLLTWVMFSDRVQLTRSPVDNSPNS